LIDGLYVVLGFPPQLFSFARLLYRHHIAHRLLEHQLDAIVQIAEKEGVVELIGKFET